MPSSANPPPNCRKFVRTRCSTPSDGSGQRAIGSSAKDLANTSARAATRSGPAGMIGIVTARRVSRAVGVAPSNGNAARRRRLEPTFRRPQGGRHGIPNARRHRSQVSTHCLGAMMFGAWGNTDVDDCVATIHAAIDGGINFVDTADVYSAGRVRGDRRHARSRAAATRWSSPRRCTARWGPGATTRATRASGS